MDDIAEDLEAIARLRELAAGTDDLIVCILSVNDYTILWASPRGMRALLGREPDDVVGRTGPAVLAGLTAGDGPGKGLARMMAGQTLAATYLAEHRDGTTVPLRLTGWLVDDRIIVGLATRAGSDPGR